ncbi:adenylate/guanylate cyclase domain-containing protein [Neptunicoccus sediminis]|uniref:adenylate/guanylate cyclase domain-containing protein n=1 Tax=Neptunicoccus sediminis TaxID=1892596 RepID=UPI0008460832|nr:adenylate/guanylate cyclase domain-containing protein [Neptunicoccus sediminis]
MSDAQFEVIVAVVCADISGSTALYDQVGNLEARTQIDSCLHILRDVISEHGGEFIHSRGDDVLCIFEDPNNALQTMQDMLARTREGALSVHIGLDFGPAIRTRDDVFGDCVNVAARLGSLANPRESLCSRAFFKAIKPGGRDALHYFDSRKLRGKARAENIYRYADVTVDSNTQVSFGAAPNTDLPRAKSGGTKELSALIAFDGTVAECTQAREVTIGRAEGCDLVLPRQWVSRRHIIIEMRKDHAYLRDVSSNGTYVCLPGQDPILLRRETMALPGKCTLSPTKHPEAEDALSVTCQLHHMAQLKPA